MDPRRGNYPDDTAARRYGAEHYYGEPGGQAWFDPHADEGHLSGHPPAGRPPQVPAMAGPTAPPVVEQRASPPDGPPWDRRQQWDPDTIATPHATTTRESRRVVGRRSEPSSDVGSARGPARLALLVIVIVAAGLPVVRLLLVSAFGPTLSASGVVSGVLLLLGLPLGAIGLHGLTRASARTTGARASEIWLRPPAAYLAVALVLCVAAGLAA